MLEQDHVNKLSENQEAQTVKILETSILKEPRIHSEEKQVNTL